MTQGHMRLAHPDWKMLPEERDMTEQFLPAALYDRENSCIVVSHPIVSTSSYNDPHGNILPSLITFPYKSDCEERKTEMEACYLGL